MAKKGKVIGLKLNNEAQEDLGALIENIAGVPQMMRIIAKERSKVDLETAPSTISRILEVDLNVAKKLFSAITNIKSAQERFGLNFAQVIESIDNGILDNSTETWEERYQTKWEEHKIEIGRIFETLGDDHPIFLAAKSSFLKYAHQNTLLSATILSDIRPVFDSKAENVLKGLVSHNLVIRYYDSTEQRTIHFALDSADLQELRRQCERGEKKSVALQQFAAEKSWPLQIISDDDEESSISS